MAPFEDTLHQAIRFVHIAGGFAAIALFWVQVFTRKGAPLHRAAGRLFLIAGWMVVLGALAAIGLVVGAAARAGAAPSIAPDDFGLASLLTFLAIVSGVNLWAGLEAARRYRRKERLSRRVLGLQSLILTAATAGLAGYALVFEPALKWVLLGISVMGLNGAREQFVRMRRRSWTPETVLSEHAGGMSGAALAFHVAFALFGARAVFPGMAGDLQIVLPLIILVVAVWVVADGVVQQRILQGDWSEKAKAAPQ